MEIVMGKHLNLNDRQDIQTGLKAGKTFTEIAIGIGKNKSTVSREVLSNRQFVHHKNVTTWQSKNVCIHRYKCKIKEACKSPTCFRINKNCIKCSMCNDYCKSFKEELCAKYSKAPYVCNCCDKKSRCPLSKWIYDAKAANGEYKSVLSDSRKGVSLNETELEHLNKIVSPLLKKGQSVQYICSHKGDEVMVSDKTIYKYLGIGLLNSDYFVLKRKVQRKARKKAGPTMLVDKKCRVGRIFDDYKKYIDAHPDTAVVQMDTVEGKKGGKVILTLLFENCNLQLAFLRDRNDAASVTRVFNELRNILEPDEFIKLFQVVLTDRGAEFSDPRKIEIDFETGEVQSKVFYCDPQNSNQKSKTERNHEFIRYVIPKGTSLDGFTQADINKMMDNINSYGRNIFNFKPPMKLFVEIYGSEIATKLGLTLISPDDICLTPKLLKK